MTVSFVVYASAAPQGSKSSLPNGVMVESSKRVKPYRAAVVEAARSAIGSARAITGPVRLTATFFFPRPTSHYGTGRNAGVLKPSAPRFVTAHNLGDLSKLVRSTEDALTDAGVWADDKQVVAFGQRTGKAWVDYDQPAQVHITVEPLE